MKIRIEIDPFTKSGRKAYEFIESLKDKNGITYIDYSESNFLSKERIKEIEELAIEKIAERYELSKENKKDRILANNGRCLRGDKRVAGKT